MASPRPSMTGPTPVDWGQAERTPGTGALNDNKSKTDESTKVLGDNNRGVKVPAPNTKGVSGTGGRKVSGSTRISGGSI